MYTIQIGMLSGFQWPTVLSSEEADSVITHLSEVMAIMGIPIHIKTDKAQHMTLVKWNSFLHNIKHVTGIPHNPTGQAVVERPNRALKEMLDT